MKLDYIMSSEINKAAKDSIYVAFVKSKTIDAVNRSVIAKISGLGEVWNIG